MSTIVLLAVIALGGVSLMMGDDNLHHQYGVSFGKGKCNYRNQTLRNGRYTTSKVPCELWLCNVTDKTLTVIGCNVRAYGSCIHVHDSRLFWPFCCPGSPIC
ncbi:uncharacterized protein LOC115326439 [Ixodes scapularis]|uniref:uncharacterized protein LOC115326439 n=1 Tax=Ixodes scapularis TaxID=6945 RepID=UPI001A9CFB61|nr:uncharacterized protein LOC115326439 [Ixodes scapularis]